MTETGHNSQSVTGARLRSYLERIERIREDVKSFKEDEREVFAELKSDGFDAKIVRQQLKRRAMDDADRQEQDALLETYESAVN